MTILKTEYVLLQLWKTQDFQINILQKTEWSPLILSKTNKSIYPTAEIGFVSTLKTS